jgi:hypothetical protein
VVVEESQVLAQVMLAVLVVAVLQLEWVVLQHLVKVMLVVLEMVRMAQPGLGPVAVGLEQ